MARHVRPLGALARAVVQQVGPARLGMHPKTAGMLEYGGSYAGSYLLRRGLFMPWELGDLLDREMLREGLARLGEDFGVARALDPEPETAFGKVATLETALYMRNQLLRDTDWASMAHSLEVRVPLVDPVLLASVAPAMVARGAVGKGVLAAAPTKPLPDAVTNRRKTGFYTPVDQWIVRQIGPAAGRTTASRDWARTLIERGDWNASAPEPVARRAHA
jgi:asparagine synthase (glutamine-hydrolysing)